MKNIQWYPGHMTKAMRMMEQNIPLCDGVLFVLDARAPAASFNGKLKQLFKNKPILYILNKADIASQAQTDGYIRLIQSKGSYACKCVATQTGARRGLYESINKLIAETRAKNEKKGFDRAFRLMIAGIPNTGKSTVINLIAGSKRAATGDKAGVTRGKQWIRCDGFELLDTPGTMPPAFDNQIMARHLAYIGAINDDILDLDDIALCLLDELSKINIGLVSARYGIEAGQTPLEMLERVCERRGFLLKGGEFDYERAYRAVIDDFRSAKIGNLSLERADEYSSVNF